MRRSTWARSAGAAVTAVACVVALTATATAAPLAPAAAHPVGAIKLVSRSSDGDLGNGFSSWPAITGDGRYVAFESTSRNFTPESPRPRRQVYLRDRVTQETTLVSHAPDGDVGNGVSEDPVFSDDGSTVVFSSKATDLVPGEAYGVYAYDRETGTIEKVSADSTYSFRLSPDVSGDGRYVVYQDQQDVDDASVQLYDRLTGATTLISTRLDGEPAVGLSRAASISADGRFISYSSNASGIVPDDTNDDVDLFLHDRTTGMTTLISRRPDGAPATAVGSTGAVLSADGRFALYATASADLVPGDTNESFDVVVYDRVSETTTLVSRDRTGGPTNGSSWAPSISGDGRYVTYSSAATDIVDDDPRPAFDVFLHDRVTGTTTLISRTVDGKPANGDNADTLLSADGRWVAFGSVSDKLVPNDRNFMGDVFVYRRA